MKWMPYATALLSISPIVAHSAVYLSAEQAQKLMFPNIALKKYLSISVKINSKASKNPLEFFIPSKLIRFIKAVMEVGWSLIRYWVNMK